MRNSLSTFFIAAAITLTASIAQASSITVYFGQSSQPLTLFGQGPDASLNGTYLVQQGTCAASGGNTNCTLSGAYTGSTTGYTAGTYALVTHYLGTGASPLGAQSNGVGSESFFFTSIPAGTTISLDLDDVSGNNYAVPIFENGMFVNGYGLSFTSATCTGIVTCDQYLVGITPGSSISGTITGAGYLSGPATPLPATPEPPFLGLLGFLPATVYALRRRLTKN